MATGVARPSAHGQEMTSTVMACSSKPAGQNHSRDHDDRRHEDAGDLVCDLGNRCLGCRRVRNHLHDLRKGCVLADPGCPCADESALVDGRRADSISGCLIDRNRFTCQSRFIDSSRSFYDHPVDRDGFARFHDKDVSALNLVNSDRHHLAVPLEFRSTLAVFGAIFIRFFSASVVLPFDRDSSVFPTVISAGIIAALSK